MKPQPFERLYFGENEYGAYLGRFWFFGWVYRLSCTRIGWSTRREDYTVWKRASSVREGSEKS
jgi:hypothetical protein